MNSKFSKLRLHCAIITALLLLVSSTLWGQTQPSTTNIEGKTFYQIADASNLLWLANKVNSTNRLTINAILTADIDFSSYNIGIGQEIGIKYYSGTFDGNGKTIKVNISHSGKLASGLFGYVVDGTIKNLTVEGSITYVEADRYRLSTGGIVGIAENTSITNCQNFATVSGANGVGGICGHSEGGVTISDCSNFGNVSGTYAGGILGTSRTDDAVIKNCYNMGTLHEERAAYVGAIMAVQGYKEMTNCYYLEGCATYGTNNKSANGICDYDDVDGATMSKPSSAFESGEVAYLLGGSWGQNLDSEKYPVYGSDKVYKGLATNIRCTVSTIPYIYSNDEDELKGSIVHGEEVLMSDTEYHWHACKLCGEVFDTKTAHDTNGPNDVCSVCGFSMPKKVGDYYEIANADNLYWFATQVNAGQSSINAKLIDNIVVNKNVLKEDGSLSDDPSSFKTWIPIGLNKKEKSFGGIFDGQGYTISGLYINDYGNTDETQYIGLFSKVEDSGEIKNVGVIDSYFYGYVVGSICCILEGKITNCFSTATTKGYSANTTGFVGPGTTGTITNCYFAGTTSSIYQICKTDDNDKIDNCYYKETKNNNYGGGTKKSAEAFANGEVAYLLGEAWGQEIGVDPTPVLGGLKVYKSPINNCIGNGVYSNENIFSDAVTHGDLELKSDNENHWYACKLCHVIIGEEEAHDTNGANGACSLCGCSPLKDGFYEIANAEQLKWFVSQVNSGKTSINAKLIADIDFSDYNIMIGTSSTSNYYIGTFDGQGHTITLNYNTTEENTALFRYLGPGATVQNLVTDGTITTNQKFAAGIAAYTSGDNDIRTIKNCISKVTIVSNISSDGTHGGILAVQNTNHKVIIENCAFVGTFAESTTNSCGGIVGWSDSNSASYMTIKNCYVDATFGFDTKNAATIARNNPTNISNCYYVAAHGREQGTKVTREQVQNGELAYLLNGDQSEINWYQNLGEGGDESPVLDSTHKQVFANVYANCTDTELSSYGNYEDHTEQGHKFQNGVCIYCGEAENSTAIKNVVLENAGDDTLYDLAGRRVNENYRGFVITKSGKKFLKK